MGKDFTPAEEQEIAPLRILGGCEVNAMDR